MNEEKEFGATVHVMEERADTGDIVDQKRFPVDGSDPRQLFIRAMATGFRLMCGVISDLHYDNPLTFTPQDLHKRVLYTKQAAKEYGIID